MKITRNYDVQKVDKEYIEEYQLGGPWSLMRWEETETSYKQLATEFYRTKKEALKVGKDWAKENTD